MCRKVRVWCFLVLESDGMRTALDGIATSWCVILYIMTRRVRSLRWANCGQFNVFSMLDTLLVLWYLLQAYRADLLCTISIFEVDSEVWGSQTEQEYSSLGRTSAWYAWLFVCWFDVFKFLLRNPSVTWRNLAVSGPFALGPFALQVGPFALIIKTYFNLKFRSNDMSKYGNYWLGIIVYLWSLNFHSLMALVL